MDSTEPGHNQWKKSFHDEIDIGSEHSNAGLITEDPARRWSQQRLHRVSVRLVIEFVLVVLVLGLSASLARQIMRGQNGPTAYGPSCRFNYTEWMQEILIQHT